MPEIAAAGAALVVVTPQSSSRAAGWRGELGLAEAIVVADPQLTLYHALGARRPSPLWALRPRVVLAGLRAFARRERVGYARGDDTLQLGADLVVDADGTVALLHLSTDAADRVPPAELVAALRALPAAS